MRFGASFHGNTLHIIKSQRASIPAVYPISYCGRVVKPLPTALIPATTADWVIASDQNVKGFEIGEYGPACERCVELVRKERRK